MKRFQYLRFKLGQSLEDFLPVAALVHLHLADDFTIFEKNHTVGKAGGFGVGRLSLHYLANQPSN